MSSLKEPLRFLLLLLYGLLSLALVSCGEPELKGPVVTLNLQSQQGTPLPISEIQVILNGGEGETLFDLEGEFVVPLASAGENFRFGLRFPESFEGQEVFLEVFGLRDGIDVLSGEISLVVEDDSLFNVFIQFCGNQTEDAFRSEECDDGNLVDGDGCSSLCVLEFCGDGTEQADLDEQCDDGNEVDEDGCDSFCQIELCGDGKIQEGIGEACDDGNDIEGDECDSNCTFPACGNGIASPEEICYGAPSFLPAVDSQRAITADDFDDDGDVDLAVYEVSEVINIFTNDGDGKLTSTGPFSAEGSPLAAASGDFDNDGDIDLVVPSTGVTVLKNEGTGNFPSQESFSVGGSPVFIMTADLNNDGSFDIVTANKNANNIGILLSHGAGGFSPALNLPVTSPDFIAAEDLDRDGGFDLAISSNSQGKVSLFMGNGDGQFSSRAFPTLNGSPESIVVADLDNDLDIDLATANSLEPALSIFINNGLATFSLLSEVPLVNFSPDLAITGDFNNDNNLDISISSGQDIKILLNNGSGEMISQNNFGTGVFLPNQYIAEDLNQDNIPDFIVTGFNLSILFSNP